MSIDATTSGHGIVDLQIRNAWGVYMDDHMTPEQARALAAALIQLAAVAEGEGKS